MRLCTVAGRSKPSLNLKNKQPLEKLKVDHVPTKKRARNDSDSSDDDDFMDVVKYMQIKKQPRISFNHEEESKEGGDSKSILDGRIDYTTLYESRTCLKRLKHQIELENVKKTLKNWREKLCEGFGKIWKVISTLISVF